MSKEVPDNRCGKTTTYFTIPPGGVTCWREVWKDGRCIWHADEDEKPSEEIKNQRSEHPERFDKGILRNHTLMPEVSFQECKFFLTEITNSDIVHYDFSRANFSTSDLSQTSFWGSNFTDATFWGVNLTDSDLEDTNCKNADFTEEAKLIRTNLTNADLTGADLRTATLSGSKLHGTRLDGAKMDYNTKIKHVFAYDIPGLQPANVNSSFQKIQINLQTALRYLSPMYSIDPKRVQKSVLIHRKLQRILRENDLIKVIPHHYVREKHARRRQALAERNILRWFALAGARWTNLYGESPWRVVYTSFAVIIGFAQLYRFSGSDSITSTVSGPKWIEYIYFSASTFATLGFGEVLPSSQSTQILAVIEAFIGVVLMALLVAVLTRRITR